MADFPIDVVIVEDEVASQKAIIGVLGLAWPKAKVLGIAASVPAAQAMIIETKPQLVLLDIRLQDLTGFDLLELFPERTFDVIVMSAHSEFEFARTAISLGVKEYLLKPVSIDLLKDAISKLTTAKLNPNDEKLTVNLHYGNQVFLNIQDIVMVEADGSYSVIYMTTGEKHVVSKYLNYIEKQLSVQQFSRVHDCNIVNKDHIIAIDKNNRAGVILLTNDIHAKLASRKRGEVTKWIKLKQK
jgi:two-component system, LytTR family, response regulator